MNRKHNTYEVWSRGFQSDPSLEGEYSIKADAQKKKRALEKKHPLLEVIIVTHAYTCDRAEKKPE